VLANVLLAQLVEKQREEQELEKKKGTRSVGDPLMLLLLLLLLLSL